MYFKLGFYFITIGIAKLLFASIVLPNRRLWTFIAAKIPNDWEFEIKNKSEELYYE